MRRQNVSWLIVCALLAATLLAVLFRHAVARFAVSEALGLATGYHVAIGEMRLGRNHGAFLDAHISSRRGEPILDARRIDLYYNLRDLLPGGRRRFGFVGLSLSHPSVTLIRHQDGTFNVAGARGGVAGRPAASRTPLFYTARIRDGSITLIDRFRLYREARTLGLHDVNADVSVKSNERTHYTIAGVLRDAGRDYPLGGAATIDYARGFAIHHFAASQIPVRDLANYAIDTRAAHVFAGLAHDVDARIYALGITPDVPIDYHLAATARLSGGQLYVEGLEKPIRDASGRLNFFDDGLAAPRLDATLANAPVRIAGAIYNFSDPQFRLGIIGAGDLQHVRSLFGFSASQPAFGPVAVRTLVEGGIGNPLILVGFRTGEASFAGIPIVRGDGVLAVFGDGVDIAPLRLRYGAVDVSVRGRLVLGKHLDSRLVVGASGPANAVPYAAALLPDSRLEATALVDGSDLALGARGVVSSSAGSGASGAFSIDRSGTGTFGPLAIVRSDGSSFVGGLALDRPHNGAAFWISARHFKLAAVSGSPVFPGVPLPALPPLSGTLDGDLVALTQEGATTASGSISGRGLRLDGIAIDAAQAQFGGTLGDVRASGVHARGPWGSLDGEAGMLGSAFALSGTYDGTLEALQAFTGDVGGRGRVAGPVALISDGARTTVQFERARFSGATVRGVPIEAASGTFALRPGGFDVYAADASLAGGRAVAAGDSGALAVSAVGVDAARLGAAGLPLSAGRFSAVGTASLGAAGPRFDGGVLVSDGASSYGGLHLPLGGSAEISLAGSRLGVREGAVTAGGTVGSLRGRIDGLGSAAPRYDLSGTVRSADIATTATAFHLPVRGLTGSADADFRVTGAGELPTVGGRVRVPEGSVNGLAFRNAAAALELDAGGFAARGGQVTIGTTAAGFDAAIRGANSLLALRAPNADLSDFNDFFDNADTLGGRGRIDLAFASDRGGVKTRGDLDVTGLRYRRFQLGNTVGRWKSAGSVVRGDVQVGGAAGTLAVRGDVGLPARTPLDRIAERAHYNVAATLRSLDLATWLPAFGIVSPMTGRVDADARVVGTYPAVVITADAGLAGGTLGRLPVDRLTVSARSTLWRTTLSALRLDLPSLHVTGSGSFGLRPHDPLQLAAHATSDDLAALARTATGSSFDASGAAEADLRIGGTRATPRISGGFDVENGELRGVRFPRAVGSLALEGRNLVVRDAEVSFAKGNAFIAGSLPLTLAPFSVGPATAPLGLEFAANGVDLSDFVSLFPKDTTLGGTLNGRVAVGGTANEPRVAGGIALAGGSYRGPFEAAPITDVAAQLNFSGETAELSSLHANVGGGTIDGRGRLTFPAAGRPLEYAADLTAQHAALNFPAYGRGRVDAALHLAPSGSHPLMSGQLSLSDALLPFGAFLQSGGGSGGASAGAPLPNLGFDLRLAAGRNVRVKSGAIDIGTTGAVTLRGSTGQPSLDGRFDSTGGTLTFLNRVFRVQDGSVTFAPETGLTPFLSARATTRIINPDPNLQRNPAGNVDIAIVINGPVSPDAPLNITYESDPSYSKEQIVGLLANVAALGAVSFADPSTAGNGAAVNPFLPPGTIVQRSTGEISVSQEAFSLLSAQFTRNLLAPLETAFGGALGLSDVAFNIDYGGGFGLNVRKLLGRNVYAVYGQSFTFPVRQTFGFEARPNSATSFQLTFFQQQGATPFGSSPLSSVSNNPRATSGEPSNGTSGFSFTFQKLFP